MRRYGVIFSEPVFGRHRCRRGVMLIIDHWKKTIKKKQTKLMTSVTWRRRLGLMMLVTLKSPEPSDAHGTYDSRRDEFRHSARARARSRTGTRPHAEIRVYIGRRVLYAPMHINIVVIILLVRRRNGFVCVHTNASCSRRRDYSRSDVSICQNVRAYYVIIRYTWLTAACSENPFARRVISMCDLYAPRAFGDSKKND